MIAQQAKFYNLHGRLRQQVAMSDYTSWRVGGLAEILYLPANLADLQVFMQQLTDNDAINFFGLGSNLLVRDGGLKGAVIITQGSLNGLQCVESGLVRAEAGVSCAQLARYSARLGLVGLEFMAGIPGTVGGAVAMNAGCYGGETWDCIAQLEMIDRDGQITIKSPADFKVGYRYVERCAEWFVAASFQLSVGDKNAALAKISQLLQRRNQSQPTNLPTCGSVFRNPEQDYAARLIEACGLKGYTKGKASVSMRHANFIINEGDASAVDIESLVAEIRCIVYATHGIDLVPEVCIVGEY